MEHVIGIDQRPSSVKIKHEAFAMMGQLEGWCTPSQASIFIDLVLRLKPEKIVEIGVYGGKSLVPMAYALKKNEKGKIFGIDPWDTLASLQGVEHEANIAYWGRLNHSAIMMGLVNKIEQFGLQNQIELIRATSVDAPPIDEIDILHIDGNHSEIASYGDVIKWVPLVKKGGYIIFDDMTWFENGIYTTAKAVEWLNSHCFRIAVYNDDCTWGIWVKL